jgi:hypothetical protein
MTIPSTFSARTPGTGDNIATVDVGGVKFQCVVLADDSGHLVQTVPSYTFYVKVSAGAAAKDHFDIFNATGSGKILEIRGLWIAPSLIAAVTGLVSPDFDFYRTSAVGSGGTAVGYKAATFPSISPMDTANAALPAQVTMRVGPTAGATISEALFSSYITQEETQTGAQMSQWFNVLPESAVAQRYAAREGQGFKLRQITLGVAQNFSIFGLFTLV